MTVLKSKDVIRSFSKKTRAGAKCPSANTSYISSRWAAVSFILRLFMMIFCLLYCQNYGVHDSDVVLSIAALLSNSLVLVNSLLVLVCLKFTLFKLFHMTVMLRSTKGHQNYAKMKLPCVH